MKTLSRLDYIIALDNAQADPNSKKIIERLIDDHLGMIRHMKKTSLWDIYEYEAGLIEPMRILAYDNVDLKKEVNQLRKQLGMCEKYKEI